MAGFLASYFHHNRSLAAVVEFRCANASLGMTRGPSVIFWPRRRNAWKRR